MNSSLWAKLHGGTTHFPIALLIASLLFDILGYFMKSDRYSRDLHAAAYFSILLAALAAFVGILSGLLLTRGEMLGSGTLLKHHEFLWPAFVLLVGLAVWRLASKNQVSRSGFAIYLVVSLITTVLMSTAGYWGGELLLGAS